MEFTAEVKDLNEVTIGKSSKPICLTLQASIWNILHPIFVSKPAMTLMSAQKVWTTVRRTRSV